MTYSERKAADYRRQAAECLEVAKQMSLQDRRDAAMQMAAYLLAIAEELEGKPDYP